jgi:hypothetical protein
MPGNEIPRRSYERTYTHQDRIQTSRGLISLYEQYLARWTKQVLTGDVTNLDSLQRWTRDLIDERRHLAALEAQDEP